MTIDTAPDPSPMQRVARAIPPDARVTYWRAADGWAVRRFDRDGAGRGAILFQAGRADMFEKYLESFDHWHAAGWSVTAFDWRGQGGSGRLGADPHVGHCASFAPWIDDLAGFWRDWRAGRAGPAVLMGHSMGGYLALRAMVEGRVAPDAAVLVAPMLGLRSPVGAPIGGLYAAGEVTGLYHGKYTGATSVLRGLVFGRIAGRHAVERCVARRSATSLPDKE